MAKIGRTTALMGVRVAVTPASAAPKSLAGQAQPEIRDAGTRSIKSFVQVGATLAQRLAGNQKEGARKNQQRGRPRRRVRTRVRGSCSDHGNIPILELVYLVYHNEPSPGTAHLARKKRPATSVRNRTVLFGKNPLLKRLNP